MDFVRKVQMFIVPLDYKQPLGFYEDSSGTDNVCLSAYKNTRCNGQSGTHSCFKFYWQLQGIETPYTCLNFSTNRLLSSIKLLFKALKIIFCIPCHI